MHDLTFFYPEGHAAHAEPGHPESPLRVEALVTALREAGWWEAYPHLPPLEILPQVLHAVHSPIYLSLLKEACARGGRLIGDTYLTPASWELALQAAGGGLAVAQAVWQGQARRGFALTRPPGHHATCELGMGFCLLNNIALAAQSLVQQGAQRLAIIDLDLHHGNGTQDIFYERGDVLYISTHQSPLFPGTGNLNETGVGAGLACTANFPLSAGSGDEAFLAVMDRLILPLLGRFEPQMLLVSYGFDPHWKDPLGSLLLSAAGYGALARRLADWADAHCAGRVAVFLEGGYHLEAGAACTQAVVAALLGLPWQDALGPSPQPESQAWRSMLQRALQLWGL